MNRETYQLVLNAKRTISTLAEIHHMRHEIWLKTSYRECSNTTCVQATKTWKELNEWLAQPLNVS